MISRMSSYQMHNPDALFTLLLLIPLWYLAWLRLREMERVRRWTLISIRSLVLIALILLLSDIQHADRTDRLTIIGLLDVSGSIREFANIPRLHDVIESTETNDLRNAEDDGPLVAIRDWFRKATEGRRNDDQIGLIVFDQNPIALATPTTAALDDQGVDRQTGEGTDIAKAIRYGLAMFPADTSKRLVLLTDGNETTGQLVEAAREAAGSGSSLTSGDLIAGLPAALAGVPIDVVPIDYAVEHEVMIERIEVPSFGRPDQRISVRIVIRSAAPTEGRLHLLDEGVAVDLNGPTVEGLSRIIQLQAGLNVITTEVTLGNAAVSRFQAIYEPLDPTSDTLQTNNQAEAFTITPQRGSVLIAEGIPSDEAGILASVLADSGFSVKRLLADDLPNSILELQAFDLVILHNAQVESVKESTQENLNRYVDELGGGLIMIGGYDSFGAGRWEDTAVAEVLPVSLDIPDELRIPTAAIAIVIDRSGSMNYSVMGTRRSKQEIANEGAAMAIGLLDKNDYVAVYSFASTTRDVVPMQLVQDPEPIADRIRSIRAEGGTNMFPALQRAHRALQSVDAEIKHVVCLSDGQSQGGGFVELAQQMNSDGITVSTIAVGDDADTTTLEEIAIQGGGTYYFVRNPDILPRVFVKDIQVVRHPLIREGAFSPTVRSTGSVIVDGLAGRLPPLHGLVLTQPRTDNATATVLIESPEGDPILATAQFGLGRTAAFTSDAHDDWAREWISQPTYRQLWTQLCRSIARPPGNRDFALQTTIENDRLRIRLIDDSTASQDGSEPSSIPLTAHGVVYAPDGSSIPIRLNRTGPTLYEATVEATQSGNYVVAITPQRGTEQFGIVLGGINRSLGLEYRRLRSSPQRVLAAAAISGGRILDLKHPETAGLFDSEHRRDIVTLLPLWPVLLVWGVVLLVVDIALRRIAWTGTQIRDWVQQTLARIRLTPLHAAHAESTLGRLRTVNPTTPSASHLKQEQVRPDTPVSLLGSTRHSSKTPPHQPTKSSESNTSTRPKPSDSSEPSQVAHEKEVKAAQQRGLAALMGDSSSTTDDSASSADGPSLDQPAAPPTQSAASRMLERRRKQQNSDE